MKPETQELANKFLEARAKAHEIRKRHNEIRNRAIALKDDLNLANAELEEARKVYQSSLGREDEADAKIALDTAEGKAQTARSLFNAMSTALGVALHKGRPSDIGENHEYRAARSAMEHAQRKLYLTLANEVLERFEDFEGSNLLRLSYSLRQDSGTLCIMDWPEFLANLIPFKRVRTEAALAEYGVGV